MATASICAPNTMAARGNTKFVRILIGGRYDVPAQRERVFDPFGSLAGEPTASLSKGTQGYFNPRGNPLPARRPP